MKYQVFISLEEWPTAYGLFLRRWGVKAHFNDVTQRRPGATGNEFPFL